MGCTGGVHGVYRRCTWGVQGGVHGGVHGVYMEVYMGCTWRCTWGIQGGVQATPSRGMPIAGHAPRWGGLRCICCCESEHASSWCKDYACSFGVLGLTIMHARSRNIKCIEGDPIAGHGDVGACQFALQRRCMSPCHTQGDIHLLEPVTCPE